MRHTKAGRGPRDRGRPLCIGMAGSLRKKGNWILSKPPARLLAGCRFVICGAPLFSDPAAARYFERVRESADGLPVEFLGWRNDVGAVLSELDSAGCAFRARRGHHSRDPRSLRGRRPGGRLEFGRHSGDCAATAKPDSSSRPAILPGLPRESAKRWQIRPRYRRIAANAQRGWRERFTLARISEADPEHSGNGRQQARARERFRGRPHSARTAIVFAVAIARSSAPRE